MKNLFFCAVMIHYAKENKMIRVSQVSITSCDTRRKISLPLSLQTQLNKSFT